jgi:hypothetical protein
MLNGIATFVMAIFLATLCASMPTNKLFGANQTKEDYQSRQWICTANNTTTMYVEIEKSTTLQSL